MSKSSREEENTEDLAFPWEIALFEVSTPCLDTRTVDSRSEIRKVDRQRDGIYEALLTPAAWQIAPANSSRFLV